MNDSKRLQDILKTMDVPRFRRTDSQWLVRNLAVRNRDHPMFPEAMAVVKRLLRSPDPAKVASKFLSDGE